MNKLISTKKKIENDDFRIIVGTTNKKKPNTFYVEISFFAKILNENVDVQKSFANINKLLRGLILNATTEYCLRKDFILDVNVSKDSLSSGQTSYATIEMSFAQNKYDTFNDVVKIANAFLNKNCDAISNVFVSNGIICQKNREND